MRIKSTTIFNWRGHPSSVMLTGSFTTNYALQYAIRLFQALPQLSAIYFRRPIFGESRILRPDLKEANLI